MMDPRPFAFLTVLYHVSSAHGRRTREGGGGDPRSKAQALRPIAALWGKGGAGAYESVGHRDRT